MAEKSIKEYVFRKGAANRVPVSGTFEITSRCNLDCKMCYVHMSPEEQAKIGQELTAKEWIQIGKEAVKNGMIYLLLTGGEPLLRPDFLTIYTELVQMGLLVSINTNATLITPEIVSHFQKYRPEKVNITLYGMSDDTYGNLCGNCHGFERAVRGIRMLKEAGIRICLNTTFTKLNVKDMDAIVEFAKEEGIPIRMAAYIFPPVRNGHETEDVYLNAKEQGIAAAHFDQLTLEPDKFLSRQKYIQSSIDKDEILSIETEGTDCRPSACMAGKGAFWISWDGNMYPCGMLPDYSVNIRNIGFQQAWKETVDLTSTILLPAECTNCKYKKICSSCAAVAQSVNGATNQVPKDLCERTKAYVDAILEN